MKTNETYTARATFTTIDQDDQQVTFQAGYEYKAGSFDSLIDAVTGEVVKLPLHIARNPDWYFNQVGVFNPGATPKVSQSEYARELVRGTEGLDFRCLWDIGTLEGWLPCQTPPKDEHVFSACLSTHDKIEVRLDGLPVKGTRRERGQLKGYTYHAKRSKAA